jgi:hypothetical protein
MSEMAHQKTDDELRHLLDQPGLWLIYRGGVLAEEGSLRKALLHAQDLLAKGSSISEIIRTPGNGVVVPAPQMHRLLMLPDFATPKAVTGRKAKTTAKPRSIARKMRKAVNPKTRKKLARKPKATPARRGMPPTSAPRRTARSQSRRRRMR